MEVVSHMASATATISNHFYFFKLPPNTSPAPVVIFRFSHFPNNRSHFYPSSSSFSSIFCSFSTRASVTSAPSPSPSSLSSISADNNLWMVVMESPPVGIDSKSQVIDYYVKTLQKVLKSEKDAQMCIYDASWENHFGFCCHIDEQTSRELAQLPEVLLVKPDTDFNSIEKDYSSIKTPSSSLHNPQGHGNLLFPSGKTKQWLVQVDKPNVGIVTKAQMVDFYAQLLSKVLGNEKDAQMCIYHVCWQTNFGFCCELDEDCARELAGVPGVLSVQPDRNFESENKDYEGNNLRGFMDSMNSSEAAVAPIKTKKLFVTGLSFYTSEKTLRSAFEGFGELVEVKIIMDKISKRSKGYAFIEYTTEEAATAALKDMNGKIINGWMIVVDVAKPIPSKSSRRRPPPQTGCFGRTEF